MKLIGQYDSPFVRRVAIAMRLLGFAYEHCPWSVFRDADRIAEHNPLLRVPVLVLDDGPALIESHAIVDYLELRSGRSLWPQSASDRVAALRITCLATGVADKAVSLVYERLLHDSPSIQWIDRCTGQIRATLAELEQARGAIQSEFLFGSEIGHADIALACALRFIGEAHADDFDLAALPALLAHSVRCEERPEFAELSQPFTVTVKSAS